MAWHLINILSATTALVLLWSLCAGFAPKGMDRGILVVKRMPSSRKELLEGIALYKKQKINHTVFVVLCGLLAVCIVGVELIVYSLYHPILG